MNPDVLIDDLKRKCASNESLWLIGQAILSVGVGRVEFQLSTQDSILQSAQVIYERWKVEEIQHPVTGHNVRTADMQHTDNHRQEPIKFGFRNIGPVKDAELELGDSR